MFIDTRQLFKTDLRAVRLRKNLTQAEAAQEVGETYNTYRFREAMGPIPGEDKIILFANFMEISKEEFLRRYIPDQSDYAPYVNFWKSQFFHIYFGQNESVVMENSIYKITLKFASFEKFLRFSEEAWDYNYMRVKRLAEIQEEV